MRGYSKQKTRMRKKHKRDSKVPQIIGSLVIVLVLVILIKLGLGIFGAQAPEVPTEDAIIPNVTEETINLDVNDNLNVNEIALDDIKSNFVETACVNLSGAERDYCLDSRWNDAAFHYNNIAICEQISDRNAQIGCKDNVTLSVAKSMRNVSYCEEISQPELVEQCRDWIYFLKAEGDLAYCRKISNQGMKTECEEQTASALFEEIKAHNDTALCEQLVDFGLEDACKGYIYNEITGAAVLNNDVLSCEKLLDADLVSNCKDEVYFKIAVSQNSTAFCNEISDSEFSGLCKSVILSSIFLRPVKLGDITLCEEAIEPELVSDCKDIVYYKIAASNNNIADCNSILDADLALRCRSHVSAKVASLASQDNNISGCNVLSEPALVKECKDVATYRIAIRENNISLCDDISDSDLIAQCKDVLGV